VGRRNLADDTAASLRATFGVSPFSAQQALTTGCTPARLAAAVRSGALRRVRRGMYVVDPDARTSPAQEERSPSPVMSTSERGRTARIHSRGWRTAVPPAHRQSHPATAAAATALLLPGAAVSHTSAAFLHRLPVPLGRAEHAHVTQPGARVRTVGGVRVHRAQLPRGHVEMLDEVLVTSPARTALDVARMSTLPQALICVDAALRRLVATAAPEHPDLRLAVADPGRIASARAVLEDTLAAMRGWPGTSIASRALALGDPAAESPLESESRGVLIQQHLPPPECGVPVRGADGQLYWVDMLWRAQRVIGECDGAMKYSDPDALYREKLRQEALEQAGWRVIRWRYAEILYRPERLLARLRWALSAP